MLWCSTVNGTNESQEEYSNNTNILIFIYRYYLIRGRSQKRSKEEWIRFRIQNSPFIIKRVCSLSRMKPKLSCLGEQGQPRNEIYVYLSGTATLVNKDTKRKWSSAEVSADHRVIYRAIDERVAALIPRMLSYPRSFSRKLDISQYRIQISEYIRVLHLTFALKNHCSNIHVYIYTLKNMDLPSLEIKNERIIVYSKTNFLNIHDDALRASSPIPIIISFN